MPSTRPPSNLISTTGTSTTGITATDIAMSANPLVAGDDVPASDAPLTMAQPTMARRVVGYLPALLIVLGALTAWEVWVRVADVADYVLPAPSEIAAALWTSRSVLVSHTLTTASEALIGLALGGVTGVGLALAMSSSRTLMRGLSPLLVVSQTIPIIVLAPLLVLWFGFGLAPKVIVVALMTFFPVAISTIGGLLSVDPLQVELLHSMGARPTETMRYLQIPHSIPAVVDGLRVAAAYAVGGAVVGEWTGATAGLGVFISHSRKSFRIDQVFAGVAVVAIVSVGLFAAVDLFGRLAAPWFYRRRSALASRPAGVGK